jgi:hypothetical protein
VYGTSVCTRDGVPGEGKMEPVLLPGDNRRTKNGGRRVGRTLAWLENRRVVLFSLAFAAL